MLFVTAGWLMAPEDGDAAAPLPILPVGISR
jgi:hypothetical protein